MKISELTYEYLQSVGLSRAHIHTDNSDGLRSFGSEESFEDAKLKLMENYGDVNIIVDPDNEYWFNQIRIDDAKWQADHEDFCRRKAEWCNQNGCD